MTAPTLNSFDNIIRQLKAKKSGGGWVACCPAHDDRTPSLSIDLTPDGTVPPQG